MNENLRRIQQGTHHDPFDWLGWHPLPDGNWVLRTFMPAAEAVNVVGHGLMTRLEGTDCFEARLPSPTDTAPSHPALSWQDKQSGNWHDAVCPYTFAAQVGDLDLHLLGQGRHHHAWKVLGSHASSVDGIAGTLFAVWAPAVKRVSVIGDFNAWDGRCHPMRVRGDSGVWEIFIPGIAVGTSYKYEILNRHDAIVVKTDPYAQQMFMRPETTSRVPNDVPHPWQDSAWIAAREQFDWQHQPMSVYELHPGSWRKHPDERFYSWAELAATLIPYVTDLNYTHIELMPVAEHPLDESWG